MYDWHAQLLEPRHTCTEQVDGNDGAPDVEATGIDRGRSEECPGVRWQQVAPLPRPVIAHKGRSRVMKTVIKTARILDAIGYPRIDRGWVIIRERRIEEVHAGHPEPLGTTWKPPTVLRAPVRDSA